MNKPQHYQITLESAIAHYEKGDFTVKGLLHVYIKIRLKDGWTLKETQKEITDKLGISRAAFYLALSRLKAEGSINWSAPANTKFTISLNSFDSNESTFEDNQSTIADNQSMIVDNQSMIVDNQSMIVDNQSMIADNPSTIADNESMIADSASFIVTEEKPEPKQGKGLRKPSYSSSYSSSDFLSTFISSLSSDAEREIFEKFCLEAASRMPTQPTLISRWVEVNAKSLIEEYQLRVLDRKVVLKDEFDYEVNYSSDKSSGNSPIVENQEEHSPSAAVMDQCQCSQCSSAEEEEICW
jgi:hypothetical protein